ncbi:unnamed protein product [Prorocentrum cordatum]|uniref:Uncharacterized protein n=1 Tax=Prorocentrum cordatum TaxID=2364126 RepID=A0ABN9QBF2_9DINO|nr:unnamed protein product [Polarella glacialis]
MKHVLRRLASLWGSTSTQIDGIKHIGEEGKTGRQERVEKKSICSYLLRPLQKMPSRPGMQKRYQGPREVSDHRGLIFQSHADDVTLYGRLP